jgi:hypothetical protein
MHNQGTVQVIYNNILKAVLYFRQVVVAEVVPILASLQVQLYTGSYL